MGKQYNATQNYDGSYSLVSVTKEYAAKNGGNGTITLIQAGGSAAAGPNVTGSIQLVMDFHGQMGWQSSYGFGVGTPSASVSIGGGASNAKGINELAGFSIESGSGGGIGFGGAGNYIIGLKGDSLDKALQNIKDPLYIGGEGNFTVNAQPGVETHSYISYTNEINSWNYFESPFAEGAASIAEGYAVWFLA